MQTVTDGALRPLVVRVGQVPELTGIGKSKLHKDIFDKPGGIPRIRCGGVVMVRVVDIEAWLERLAGGAAA